ncbi:uncharacterized protein CcaverHIS019_0406410 [Cutaneotrichosporon cavernicola]|uniref:Coenzyme Q-binding protein COQ10 START domain-containing protein n=1 Tax=Cutaneotrichosporon cavernicola TaxID=279322 RepID=A0AA48L4H5_9TREE|nr:uncharacterized protein CcaverHIS019_0406410 [Cutaneotrichosporon cavernicola]BEI91821.1 hypothetical protein CcaverHIS019_0406410 [Cutaneotrichosporon cavernicola]BEI99592.1 hypothetical protein CcaverHIS631_0406350 [Cutaneotrichosporon cavernicola]BEJ07368.1 hypothetical protein CcaverHIS641_0406370 [Cutaneotrichosporon cavernicola]
MKPSLTLARSSRALQIRPARPLIASAGRPGLSARAAPARTAPARTFFSLPDITRLATLIPGPEIENTGEEQRFHARKVLPYSPAQLYELVSDVPAYVDFIPFCTASTVLDTQGYPTSWRPGPEPFAVDAELAVGFGGLEERYVSRVVGTPFESVSATASKRTPLFKNLVTTWSFAPAGTGGHIASSTLLTIDLTFAFANPLHRIASQAVLPKVADKMVEAFETRAGQVYGAR